MRFSPRPALLALSTFAVMAFGASNASAAEVVTEANGVHCATVILENVAPANPEVTAGCPLRGGAQDLEFGGAFGAMAVCDVQLEGRINETGQIIWGNYAIGSCEQGAAAKCMVDGERHPRLAIIGGAAPGPWPMEANICFVAFGMMVHCHVLANLVQPAAHSYRINFIHANPCENGVHSLQGQIVLIPDDAHPRIEVG